MQNRLIENYKQQIERKINKIRSKNLNSNGAFKKLPADKAHLDERRQELYQFLLKNNEGTRNYHQEYKTNQDKKIQKIMQEYIGLVKFEQNFE